MGAAASSPVINDVSTNVDDPPAFSKSNHAAALPESFKRSIAQHYSHVKPLVVQGVDKASVFDAAVAAAAALPRCRIVHQDAEAGVLELLDVTKLMRFKDDVSVRVRPVGGDVVVDVRSASRMGKGDLGANAARIQAYLGALRAELGAKGGGGGGGGF